MANTLTDILRIIFLAIDWVVYWLIELVYNLFFFISSAKIIDNTVLQELYDRIFVLLGIFMVFRLTFSLIQMLINPDLISDKSKGIGKIISRIIVSLISIIMVTTVFDLMYEAQGYLMEENVFAKIILTPTTSDSGLRSTENVGTDMKRIIFQSFCPLEGTPTDADLQQVNAAVSSGNIGDYFAVINARDASGAYVFNYLWLVSSVCAVLIAWVFVIFSIDVAIRMAKLAFLQLIAPIPILAYIDPNSDTFKNWGKAVLKAYIDVFLRITVICFAIFIINAIL